MEFNSRRSMVMGTRGAVASSQPLASEAGLRILQKGGNAADAAVAMAAALNVTEPCSTGIGGDCFVLYFDNKTKQVSTVLGNGRSPAGLSLDLAKGDWNPYSVHTVTVPGACAGWCDTVQKFGKLTMKDVLQPAIELAEQGFPVGPVASHFWRQAAKRLRECGAPYSAGADMLIDGEGPLPGQIFKNPNLAQTFRKVVEGGKDGFYKGAVADAIVQLCTDLGGTLTASDLQAHVSTYEDPICTNYKGVDVYEIPPPTQGIAALIALNILEGLDVSADHNSTAYLHTLVECMRMAFTDCRAYVADPSVVSVPAKGLLCKDYAAERRKLFDANIAQSLPKGKPLGHSETVYFCAVDGEGNACSMINSNYMGFGTHLVPKGCGFSLQNRGYNFSLDPTHPNVVAPQKRPFHTIIPGMAVKGGELYAAFGVMGGFMQPQGHMQVLVNMIDKDMDPQGALDAPRFCLCDDGADAHTTTGDSGGAVVSLEEGMSSSTIDGLAKLGHKVNEVSGHGRGLFGRGQIIRRDPSSGVLTCGSDPRADGCAMAY